MTLRPLFRNTYILRRPTVANFAGIIKIATVFQNNLERLKQSLKSYKLCIKMQSMIEFLGITKVADFCWKDAHVSRTQKVCHVIYKFFGSFLNNVNCAKVHNCRICETGFSEEGLFGTLPTL